MLNLRFILVPACLIAVMALTVLSFLGMFKVIEAQNKKVAH